MIEKGAKDKLSKLFLSITLSLNTENRRVLIQIKTIIHHPEHKLHSNQSPPPQYETLHYIFMVFYHHFPTTTKTISLRSSEYFLSLWHLLQEREHHVCFSSGPEIEPVGWTLITMEWAANGRLHCSPIPDPHPALFSLYWVSMVTCSWVARDHSLGSERGIMIGRRAWPLYFLCQLTRHSTY